MYIARYDKEGLVYFGKAWKESGAVHVSTAILSIILYPLFEISEKNLKFYLILFKILFQKFHENIKIILFDLNY